MLDRLGYRLLRQRLYLAECCQESDRAKAGAFFWLRLPESQPDLLKTNPKQPVPETTAALATAQELDLTSQIP